MDIDTSFGILITAGAIVLFVVLAVGFSNYPKEQEARYNKCIQAEIPKQECYKSIYLK